MTTRIQASNMVHVLGLGSSTAGGSAGVKHHGGHEGVELSVGLLCLDRSTARGP